MQYPNTSSTAAVLADPPTSTAYPAPIVASATTIRSRLRREKSIVGLSPLESEVGIRWTLAPGLLSVKLRRRKLRFCNLFVIYREGPPDVEFRPSRTFPAAT